jgi:hypothetical protein
VGKYKISDELRNTKYADSGQLVKLLDGRTETTASQLQTVVAADGTEQTLKDVLGQDEQDFLAFVELYITWLSRYPIAAKEEQFMEDLDVAKNSSLAALSIEAFNAMFNNIYDKLAKLARRKFAEALARPKVCCAGGVII